MSASDSKVVLAAHEDLLEQEGIFVLIPLHLTTTADVRIFLGRYSFLSPWLTLERGITLYINRGWESPFPYNNPIFVYTLSKQ